MTLNVDRHDVPFTEVLFQLCEARNHETLAFVLEKQQKDIDEDIVNLRDPSGQTPLYAAVANQSLSCARVLLEHGADPNYACSAAYFCRTPLHFCAAEGSAVEIVELLLNHGAEPLLQDLHGDTCLTLANRYGHFDLFSLMSTCSEQRDQMFELIVTQFETLLLNGDTDGAKNCILSVRNRRQTFLKHFSRHVQSVVVKCIERNLGDSIRLLGESGVDCMSLVIEPNGDNILHLAARLGAEKVAVLVLERWPSLFCRTSALGRLPLHEACERGRANIVRLFLSYQSFPRALMVTQQSPYGCYEFPIDVNHADADCRTALLDACASGNFDTVKALLDARFMSVGTGIGVSIMVNSPSANDTPVGSLSNYVSNLFRRMRVPSTTGSSTSGLTFSHSSFQVSGGTTLTTPVPNNRPPVRSGSTISLEDRSMQTAFGDFEIVSPQPKPTSPGGLFNPVDLNVFSYDRTTPLLTAIRIQNRAIAALLLQSGADPELPAQWRGYTVTPLHAAVELRDGELVDLLLQSGAIDNDCAALDAALRSAPHLVPIFLRRWSEVDREVQINVDSVTELAELSRCKTESVVPVAINWRAKPQLREIPQAWLVGCAIFHNPALLLDDFVACSVITRLDISSNAIKILPSYLFHMQSLQTLNAASNQIEEIAAGGIQRSFLSSSLREIDVSYNRLQTVPSFVFWLKCINKLYADNNLISSLPSDVWENSSLAELKLANNRLEVLPLKRLGRTPLSRQATLDALKPLSPNENKQQRHRFTSSDVTKGLEHSELQQHDLWSLELSSDVGVIADDNLPGMGANNESSPAISCCGIRFLDLSNNHMSQVPTNLVCLAPLLRTLNLSNNNINVVSRWPTDFPPALHTLDLSFNKITVFAADDSAILRRTSGEAVLPCANPSQVSQGGEGFASERARSVTRPDQRRVRSRSADRRKGSDAERRLIPTCSHRQHTSLSRLRTLNLSNNGMITFSFDSTTAPGITQMDLSSNRISVLPQGITVLQNLSVLNVSNTQITTLPPELSRLNRLWSLEITNCPLVGELGVLARGKVRTADIIYHLRASLDRARLRPITRLIVCGLPGSGKSALIEALKRAASTNSPPLITPSQDSSQPLIDWGQLTVEFRPDGPLTFRLCELSAKPDFRYVAANFLTQRCVVLVTFPLNEHPTSQVADLLASLVRDINLMIPSAPVLIVSTFADALAENAFENSGTDVMPIWKRKLTAAFQQGDPSISHVTSSSSFNNSNELFDVSVNSTDSLSSEEMILPGNCKLLIVSNTKNRKKNGNRLLREAHRLAFEWRGGVSLQSTVSNSYQSPPTLKQTVPAIFADLEIVVSKMTSNLLSARLPPLLKVTDFQEAVKLQLNELNYKLYRDIDELNQCVHFLHECGLIIHFDEPSISDLYFLSVQWLSRLVGDIINAAVKSQSTPRGLLTTSDAAEVLNRHEPTGILTKNKLISLLARLDAAFTWEGASHLLVPGLLPTIEDQNGLVLQLKQVNQAHRATFRMSLLEPGNSVQAMGGPVSSSDAFAFDLNRFYLINHIPLSFWPRLIVRLLPCELLTEILSCLSESCGVKPAPFVRIWDTKIELFTSASAESPSLIVEQLDRLHLRPGTLKWSLALNGQLLWSISSSVSLISIRVPSTASLSQPNLGVRLMSLLTEFIDQLLEDWYPSIGSRFAQDTLGSYLVYRLVPCPFCFAGNDLAMVPCFPLEELMATVCQLTQTTTTLNSASNREMSPNVGTALTCPKGHCLDVAIAAPDLVFADIPKAQLVDCAQFLDKASLLGCGALGPVISVSLAKLQQQARKNALVSSGHSALSPTATDSMSFFLPRTSSFGQHMSSKSVAIKFFNPVDIDLSSGGASNTSDQHRRLNDQLRRRFKADPIRLACEAYTSARLEMSVMLSLRHQHVLGLVGVSLRPLGLLLQLAPLGSLLDWLQTYRRVGQQLASSTAIQTIAQIADALAYLHRMGVIFRDIKSSNVLVWRFPRPSTGAATPSALSDISFNADSSVQVKVSDFSIARWSGGFGCRGQAGTPGFMAPEIIQFNGEETYTEKVDCFSFGMLIYELLTLRLPFEDRPSVNARHAVLAGLRPPPTLSMFTYGQVFTDLIASCWRKDPALRPSAGQILRIANWSGMGRVVSISSISGLPELLCTAPIPPQAGIRGSILARWSAAENRTQIDSINFDGDECFCLQRLAEHPPTEPVRKNSMRNSTSHSDTQQQVIMITCLAMSSQLLFTADIAGLIHCYRLATGEYLGCVPAGRTGCHAISLYCCSESCGSSEASSSTNLPPIASENASSGQDTLLALYSNSLLVVLRASSTSNPVLAPISRFELDPNKSTVCCMAVIRRLNQPVVSQVPGMVKSSSSSFNKPPVRKENGLTSKISLFEKKTSSNRIKSFFTRPASPDEPQICGPGVHELWLGCFDGSILLCSPKSISTPTRIRAPVLSSSSSSLSANGGGGTSSLRTTIDQGPPIASLVVDPTCESVFATLYLSSIVSRWSVRQRVLLAHFDFGEQITSILPQSSRLLLGTITGCIISSDLSTLRPLNSFPMHADSTLALLPVSNAPSVGEDQGGDLVVSLGRGLAEPLSELLPQAAPTSRMCVVSLSFS